MYKYPHPPLGSLNNNITLGEKQMLFFQNNELESDGDSALPGKLASKLRNISPALLLLLLPRRQIPSLFSLFNNDKLAGISNASAKTPGEAPATAC